MKELFTLIGKIAIDNNAANNSIDDTTGRAEKSEGRISGAFKKIGAAAIAAFSISSVIAFGQACVETAAAIQASNSQFQQTFTVGGEDLTATAKNVINEIANVSGILATRLQDSGTKIYSFAKASGADSAEAMELMDGALRTAADSAAYYDVSLEQATETLQSFLKGNFENDAALGVSATEATRNAKAMELFGQEYNNLTEIQKQQTLLKMVTDAQSVSGAMGQAAREADGWENVTGNLKEAWKQFQGVLGTPVLKAVVPIIKGITDGISTLTDKLNLSSGSFDSVKEKISGLFSDSFKESLNEFAGGWQAVAERMQDSIFSSFAGNFEKIQTAIQNLQPVVQQLVENYLMNLMYNIDMIMGVAENVVVPIINFVATVLTDLVTTITTAVTPAIVAISNKFTELYQIVSAAVNNYIIPTIQSFIQMIQELYAENQDKIQLIGELFNTVFNAIADIVSWFVEVVKNYIYPFVGWLADIIQSNMDNIKAVFQAAFDFIAGIIQFFIALFQGDWTAMWEAVKAVLTAAKDFIVNIFNLLVSIISSVGSAIWSVVKNAFENVRLAIATKLTQARDTVISIFNDIKNGISEKIENAKQVVQDGIEKLKSFFSFNWELPKIKLPHFSISGSFSLNPPSIPSFGIEWYKDGGVMMDPTAFGINPATGKTMVGGEAGAEAIAPIETLQSYVRDAVAGQNGEIIAILNLILSAIYMMNENLGNKLYDTILGMRFEINGREFARLVKEV